MISVCMATYNGERFLRQQIDSILAQLGDGDELIISDDGSTDGTTDIIRSVGDDRIRLVEGPRRASATWNFENVLRQARGEYIFLSDQDDVWTDNKVAVMMEHLKRHDCVVSDARMVDERLNVLEESYFKVHGTRPGRLCNTLLKNGYMGCCMAFSRRVRDAALPFPKDIPLHDIWIGNVAAYRYGVRFIADKLVLFRCHSGNNSFTAAKKSGNSPLKMLKIRLVVVKDLMIKLLKW